MKNFLNIALLSVSLFFILNACSLRHHSGYKETDSFELKENDFIANHFQKVLFKTQIQALGNQASGLLFIKLMQKDDYRFVFLTQLGMKIFDVEWDNNQFKVHYLISYLDKKAVRKIIENDLKLLIRTPLLEQKTNYFLSKDKKQYLLREKVSGEFYYYAYQDHKIILKEKSNTLFEKTQIQYFYNGGNRPREIKINHSGINIKWQLEPIKKKLKLKDQ